MWSFLVTVAPVLTGEHRVDLTLISNLGLKITPLRTEIAAIFATCDCDAHRGPQKSQRFPRQARESNAALRFKGAIESR